MSKQNNNVAFRRWDNRHGAITQAAERAMTRRSHWSNWQHTPESIERHLAISEWSLALHEAYKRDTRKLCAYLRRTDLPLDQDKREQLADLIDRRIHRKTGKGRKLGRIPPANPEAITPGYIAALARPQIEKLRRRNGGKAPRGALPAAVNDVCRRLGDDGYNIDDKLAEAALAKLRKRW
jgi:hypothetical protein